MAKYKRINGHDKCSEMYPSEEGPYCIKIPDDGDLPCPVCGAPYDEYVSCGCYEDIHYGD